MTTEEIQALVAKSVTDALTAQKTDLEKAFNEKLEALKKTEDPKQLSFADLQLEENARIKKQQDELNFRASKIALYNSLKEKHGQDGNVIFSGMDGLLNAGSRDDLSMQDFLSRVDGVETELLKVRMSKEDITEPIKARYENGSIRDFKALEFELAEEAKRKQAEEERNKQNDIKNGLNNINKLLPAVEFAKFTPAQKHTYVATIANNNYFDKLNNQLRPKTA